MYCQWKGGCIACLLTLAHFGDETREEDELSEHEHHRLAREQEACTESDTQALASCCLRGAITPLHTQLQRLESKLVLHVQPKHGLSQHPSLTVLAQRTTQRVAQKQQLPTSTAVNAAMLRNSATQIMIWAQQCG